jgi:hypothetical protein
MAPIQLLKDFKHKLFLSNCVPVGFTPSTSFSQIHEVNYMMFDPAQAKANVKASKKQKKVYEMNCRFQDTWDIKLPWVESIVRDDGRVK